jgi:hypothetical protein
LSFRRGGVQALQEAGVPEQIIAKKVGHSNVQHLAPYCEVSETLDEVCHETLAIDSQPESLSTSEESASPPTSEEPEQVVSNSATSRYVQPTTLGIPAVETACYVSNIETNGVRNVGARVAVEGNSMSGMFAHCSFSNCSIVVNVKPL